MVQKWKEALVAVEQEVQKIEQQVEDFLQKPMHMHQVDDKCPQKEVDYLVSRLVLEQVLGRLVEKKVVAHQFVLQNLLVALQQEFELWEQESENQEDLLQDVLLVYVQQVQLEFLLEVLEQEMNVARPALQEEPVLLDEYHTPEMRAGPVTPEGMIEIPTVVAKLHPPI